MHLWEVAFWSPIFFSEEYDHLFICSVIKGLLIREVHERCGLDERCRAESSGGLPRSLYLWPLILNICTYMTTLFSAVLTLQKIAICLQVCLVLGHCHHQNDCCDDVLGDLLMAFEQGS